ncbi:multi protein bridging factor 1-domain-containing protein [Chytridium lagenaria]|nr:multi protein bridging factor 1-domain-containing protein [Chytridium lagenaria]
MSGWDDVTVIKKRPERATVLKSESEINAARRAGVSVSTEKKGVANNNGPSYDPGKQAKLDRETERGKAIQQGRQAKNLTQKDLATKINEKQTVVNEYESGKAANPNQQVLQKMERVLGIKLRGQNIGSPLGSKQYGLVF